MTPAIQFPKKNLDVQSAGTSGPPTGTVIHASLLGGTPYSREAGGDTTAGGTNGLGDKGRRGDAGVGVESRGEG